MAEVDETVVRLGSNRGTFLLLPKRVSGILERTWSSDMFKSFTALLIAGVLLVSWPARGHFDETEMQAWEHVFAECGEIYQYTVSYELEGPISTLEEDLLSNAQEAGGSPEQLQDLSGRFENGREKAEQDGYWSGKYGEEAVKRLPTDLAEEIPTFIGLVAKAAYQRCTEWIYGDTLYMEQ